MGVFQQFNDAFSTIVCCIYLILKSRFFNHILTDLYRVRLMADGVLIHDYIAKPNPMSPLQFLIPHNVTADGSLELKWCVLKTQSA